MIWLLKIHAKFEWIEVNDSVSVWCPEINWCFIPSCNQITCIMITNYPHNFFHKQIKLCKWGHVSVISNEHYCIDAASTKSCMCIYINAECFWLSKRRSISFYRGEQHWDLFYNMCVHGQGWTSLYIMPIINALHKG